MSETRHVGRPGKLDDPEFAEQVGLLYATGATRDEMAQVFHVTPRTINRWTNDPRVRLHATAAIRERVTRVVRKVDGELENRLRPGVIQELEVKELIDIRKALANRGTLAEDEGEAKENDALNDLMRFMDENPDLAAQMAELETGGD